MQRRTWIGLGLIVVGVGIGSAIHHLGKSPESTSFAQVPLNKPFLLHVSAGQKPLDTNSSATTFALEDSALLGGRALRVYLGDSFGDSPTRVTNWTPFSTLAFNVYNPDSNEVKIWLAIAHRGSKSYETRIDVPLVFQAGKNEIRLPLASLTNTDQSQPDLAHVERWYLYNRQQGTVPILIFSDFWFEPVPTTLIQPAPSRDAISQEKSPAQYQIKGKIGSMEVDLIVSPLGSNAPILSAPAKDNLPVIPNIEWIAPPAEKISEPLPESKKEPKAEPTPPFETSTSQTMSQIGPKPPKKSLTRLERIRSTVMPRIEKPVSFETAEADAICAALEIFPPNNPWNILVEDWPVHSNSRNIVAAMGMNKPLRYSPDMSYIFVPTSQKKINVKLVGYPDESDPGPYPVPDNLPIELWPVVYKQEKHRQHLSLEDVQYDRANLGGDRHAIVVDPVNRRLYEFYTMKRTSTGWQASQASIFDLKSNKLRPEGWTSSDAAGLPIFPAVVRYDEIERGMVEHAMRVTFEKTRRAYVYPATHYASKITDENVPRMGERFRLKRDFNVSKFSPAAQAILKGLQKYGMIVADNGMDWMISVAPDPRIPSLHGELRQLKGSDFEVITPPPGYQIPRD